ncbi:MULTISPECIES: hypothetical protein [Actinomadura]|uniref:Uncharacterized protein n=1 Tax=Actinomadura litoris TaxID=2678616 RepID=A0A7K1LA28_9ACTN|nr:MULTISPECIES: hypothetical protein [Actinomadura]MBT2207222.1 hypothetical protein [Actinomadura sp. NEAU-AAG7]MUN41096.1 hypothetical protein [Actinomadura litoris]
MATTPRRTPAHQLMVNCLYHSHIQHGQPPLPQILRTLKRLPELYTDFAGAADGTGLSSTANIQKIIMGSHHSLPSAVQLSRLILAFQHLAWADGVLRSNPGLSTLPGWQALLSEARTLDKEQERQGIFLRDARPYPEEPVRLPVPGPGSEPSRALTRAEPVEMTSIELHGLTTLGPYARSLAVRAATGDPGVLFEVALALFASGDPYDQRAESFAANAAAAGVSPATDLLMACKVGCAARAQLTVQQARVLEHAAAYSGDEDAALFFSGCVDRAVIPGARKTAPLLED